jgi:hypothetical protein
MSATVSPQKLKEALQAKLGTARFAIHDLRESERPETNRHWRAHQYVVDFLHAARGVYPIVETFSKNRLPQGFKAWVNDWELRKLCQSEQILWQQMRDERVSQEHGEGAGLIPVLIPIKSRDQSQNYRNAVLLGADITQNRQSKGSVRFVAYPNQLASEVCEEYLSLAQRFVNDFLSEHPHLLV